MITTSSRRRLAWSAAGTVALVLSLTAAPSSAELLGSDDATPTSIGPADPEEFVPDTMDAAYNLVPDYWGTVAITADLTDSAYASARGDDNDNATCSEQAMRRHDTVYGAPNPPRRFTEYRDSTGHRYSYVRGSATIKSCAAQRMLISTQRMIGMSSAGSSGQLAIDVPSNTWVTIFAPPIDCEPSSKQGYQYRTYIETSTSSTTGGANPHWFSYSDTRWWAYC